MSRNYYNKNLTELELGNIEFYINNRKNFTTIGKILNKDESTIRKEVKKYSSYFGETRKCSNCLNKDNYHQKYLCDNLIDDVKCFQCKYCYRAVKFCTNYMANIVCDLLKKNHQVCNGCEFLDFDLLEKSIHSDINKRMEIHYTETYASYQKPHIENNHILLRW